KEQPARAWFPVSRTRVRVHKLLQTTPLPLVGAVLCLLDVLRVRCYPSVAAVVQWCAVAGVLGFGVGPEFRAGGPCGPGLVAMRRDEDPGRCGRSPSCNGWPRYRCRERVGMAGIARMSLRRRLSG